MGILSNIANKAKGVFGRVLNGIANYAPKVGGVLNKIGSFTGMPAFSWLGKIANTGGVLANALREKKFDNAVKAGKELSDDIKSDNGIKESIDIGKNKLRKIINE